MVVCVCVCVCVRVFCTVLILNVAVTGKPVSGIGRQKVLKGAKRTAAHVRRNNDPVTLSSDAEQSTVPAADEGSQKNCSVKLFDGARVTELLAENAALKYKVWFIHVASVRRVFYHCFICLQCFDAVGWAAGRASGL